MRVATWVSRALQLGHVGKARRSARRSKTVGLRSGSLSTTAPLKWPRWERNCKPGEAPRQLGRPLYRIVRPAKDFLALRGLPAVLCLRLRTLRWRTASSLCVTTSSVSSEGCVGEVAYSPSVPVLPFPQCGGHASLLTKSRERERTRCEACGARSVRTPEHSTCVRPGFVPLWCDACEHDWWMPERRSNAAERS